MKNQSQPQAANPQDGPNNQSAPIYGPPTEKEHLRAIKAEAEKHLELAYDKYKAAKDALPPEPSKKQCDFAFSSWMEANHRAAFDYEQKPRLSYDDRLKHQREVIEPLFAQWAASEEGRSIGGPRLAWEEASAAVEADYKAARAPHEAAIAEARKRWDEIALQEAKAAEREGRIERIFEELAGEIGTELAYDLNVNHPDFDNETFEKFKAWNGYEEARDIRLNAILHGAPGTGKSRAMAYWALWLGIEPYGEYAWITGGQFAELVSALADNEQRAEAKKTLRRLGKVTWLFFDDLGSAHFTAARISHFFALMDARYKESLTTMFTTNHGLKDIRGMLCGSGSQEDATMADRILRRMIGTANDPRATFFEFKRRKQAAAHKQAPQKEEAL
jgi:DNA replication protein DnaC